MPACKVRPIARPTGGSCTWNSAPHRTCRMDTSGTITCRYNPVYNKPANCSQPLSQRCKMKIRLLLLIVGTLLISLAELPAADWPQWRGPDRDGVSKETGLLQEWPNDGPKLLWQVKDVGYGFATPAVAGDRVYLLAN